MNDSVCIGNRFGHGCDEKGRVTSGFFFVSGEKSSFGGSAETGVGRLLFIVRRFGSISINLSLSCRMFSGVNDLIMKGIFIAFIGAGSPYDCNCFR